MESRKAVRFGAGLSLTREQERMLITAWSPLLPVDRGVQISPSPVAESRGLASHARSALTTPPTARYRQASRPDRRHDFVRGKGCPMANADIVEPGPVPPPRTWAR